MKLLLLTILALFGPVAGSWCEKESTYYTNYDHSTRVKTRILTRDKTYKDVVTAKKACDRKTECGGVGVDKIPFKRKPNGRIIHNQTIFLIMESKDEIEKHARESSRYNLYVKC